MRGGAVSRVLRPVPGEADLILHLCDRAPVVHGGAAVFANISQRRTSAPGLKCSFGCGYHGCCGKFVLCQRFANDVSRKSGVHALIFDLDRNVYWNREKSVSGIFEELEDSAISVFYFLKERALDTSRNRKTHENSRLSRKRGILENTTYRWNIAHDQGQRFLQAGCCNRRTVSTHVVVSVNLHVVIFVVWCAPKSRADALRLLDTLCKDMDNARVERHIGPLGSTSQD